MISVTYVYFLYTGWNASDESFESGTCQRIHWWNWPESTYDLGSTSCPWSSASKLNLTLIHKYTLLPFLSPITTILFLAHPQVSYPGNFLSSVSLSVCKLLKFSTSSPEPLGPFQPKLAQRIFIPQLQRRRGYTVIPLCVCLSFCVTVCL